MRRVSAWTAAAVVSGALLALHGPAHGAPTAGKDAWQNSQEAAAAFSVGRYSEAAEQYEAAFALRPDAALLYNAAQSFRLAGNKARALELYRNYVRLYPAGANVRDARSHAAALKKVVEDAPPADAQPTSPPVETPTPAAPLLAPAPALPPPVGDTGVPMVEKPAAPGDEKRSLTRRTWFWVAAGAAAVLVGTTVLLLSTRDEKFPDPTFGTARGN